MGRAGTDAKSTLSRGRRRRSATTDDPRSRWVSTCPSGTSPPSSPVPLGRVSLPSQQPSAAAASAPADEEPRGLPNTKPARAARWGHVIPIAARGGHSAPPAGTSPAPSTCAWARRAKQGSRTTVHRAGQDGAGGERGSAVPQELRVYVRVRARHVGIARAHVRVYVHHHSYSTRCSACACDGTSACPGRAPSHVLCPWALAEAWEQRQHAR